MAAGRPVVGRHATPDPAHPIGGFAQHQNLDIPNEDARAVDLETFNPFALNRFPVTIGGKTDRGNLRFRMDI